MLLQPPPRNSRAKPKIYSRLWQEKHHQNSWEKPVHIPQCLQYEGTQPHQLWTALALPWVLRGRWELLPHFTAPVTEALKGDRIWPDLWRAHGEKGVLPAPAQLLHYQTTGNEV